MTPQDRKPTIVFSDIDEIGSSDEDVPLATQAKKRSLSASPALPTGTKKARKDTQVGTQTVATTPSATEKDKARKAKKSTPQDDMFLVLGAGRRVTVTTFKGETRVDIREYYTNKNTKEEKPAKKGISLTSAQWETLKSNIHLVDRMVAAAGDDDE